MNQEGNRPLAGWYCLLIGLSAGLFWSVWPQLINGQTLLFQELLPRPINDQSEYIEIGNVSNQTINLAGWLIADQAKQNKPINLPDYQLNPGQAWQINAKDIGISLNNDDETLWLWSPDGQLADTINYNKAPAGAIYRRGFEGWQWINDPAGPMIDSTSVNQAINQPISGLVTALPHQLSSQYFYITYPDNSGGLKIYCYYKLWPQLNLGDLIEVTGQAVSTTQENKINIKGPQDIKIISKSNQLSPLIITTRQINELAVGQVVTMTGKLSAKNQSTLYLTDDFGELLVQLKTGTNLKNSDFTIGQNYQITGLIINNNGLRLVPRQPEDINKIELTTSSTATTTLTLTATPRSTNSPITWLVGLSIGLIIGLIAYRLSKKTN
jgi:hypothetical protein